MEMLFTSNKINQLEDLLQRVGYKLQISKTQRELAESHYNAVSQWLVKDERLFKETDINVYPQGSLRIGTTVKPLKRQEYDLDLVIEIDEDWRQKNPLELLKLIEERLRENEMYADKVERKNRCIRLNYAHEFHLDILPAHPFDESANTSVKVPDRKAREWKDSNPKGYALWFDERSHQYEIMLEKASIDQLPKDESYERKAPLKRAVQLIKRFRDIYFEDQPENAPISIVLTTLSGIYYKGQISVVDAISSILSEILITCSQSEKRLVVLNPTNTKEDLSERWEENPMLYMEFINFIKDFKYRWDKLSEINGLHEISEELKSMFGESVVIESLKEQSMFIEDLRKKEKLSILSGSGVLVSSNIPKSVTVQKNTFFGD